MISKLEAATVREDFFTKKRSIRCIARWYGVSRNTVRRYLREEERKPYPLSEAGAFLKEHEQEICELYAKCELRCPPLRRVIKNNYDRDISLRMLERFCQPMLEEARRQVYLEEPVDRFETAPGQHLQIDFGEKDVLVNGEKVHLHFFVCKLGYSRRIFARAYYHETQEAWLDGLESAFSYFGGVPSCIVCDNASSLVRKHSESDTSLRFTERFYHFLVYWKIKGIATAVRHPQSKGKVESGVKYLKANAVVGLNFPDIETWNRWLEQWCRDETDGRHLNTLFEGPFTPRARWVVEKSALRPFDKARIANMFFAHRKVSKEGLIRVDNKYFRVDNELIGLKVQLQYDESKIIVFRGSEQVIELDKAEDGFNPCLQAESTQGTQETAVEKRLEQLKNEPRWNEFQSCAGELNRDGKAYDVSIDWVQAEPLVNKGLEMEAAE